MIAPSGPSRMGPRRCCPNNMPKWRPRSGSWQRCSGRRSQRLLERENEKEVHRRQLENEYHPPRGGGIGGGGGGGGARGGGPRRAKWAFPLQAFIWRISARQLGARTAAWARRMTITKRREHSRAR